MPEVESYRRLAEDTALGRGIAAVRANDAWYLKGGADARVVTAALVGRQFVAARRVGKIAFLDTGDGPTLGLRFGMTGRLLVDGVAGVDQLLHSSRRDEPAWDRFSVVFADGGCMVMRDPRRLGGVELDPDEKRLGVDVLALTVARLRRVLSASATPLKARLLDQAQVAGIGNLLVDEALWRAGLDPTRPSRSLTGVEVRRLNRHLRATVVELMARGGSHTGDLAPARSRDGRCPRDGAPMQRRTVGGRTTFSCPAHQR